MTLSVVTRLVAALGLCSSVVLGLAACASAAVTSDALEDRTSRALGLDKGQYTISDRVDEGTSTRYMVLAKSGKKFSCTVGGSFNVMGRVVSDAICTEMNRPAGAAPVPSNSSNCNALLKAAGKC
jgi:hypothetical protein